MSPEGAAERGDHRRQLGVLVGDRGAAARHDEHLPERVALAGRGADQAREQGGVGTVPGEQVVPAVVDGGGQRYQVVDDRLDLRGHAVGDRLLRYRRDLGQPVQVLPFRLVEPQGTGDRVEDLHAHVDRPALLQPRVPGDAHAGELGDLLAPQAGRAAPPVRRKADVVRRHLGAPIAQEVRQLGAALL